MMYDHSYPCLTYHSNQLLTNSLTIPAKIESPLRSLRSLWGLINLTPGAEEEAGVGAGAEVGVEEKAEWIKWVRPG